MSDEPMHLCIKCANSFEMFDVPYLYNDHCRVTDGCKVDVITGHVTLMPCLIRREQVNPDRLHCPHYTAKGQQ